MDDSNSFYTHWPHGVNHSTERHLDISMGSSA